MKAEFSKRLCIAATIGLAGFGGWIIVRYMDITAAAVSSGASTLPDAALPVAVLTIMMAPIVSYLLYQAGLKNSRNKYGVDANGSPYKHDASGADAPDEDTNPETKTEDKPQG